MQPGFLPGIAALLLVACLGFASHRASLCTVKAVHEVLLERRARVLASFAKAALWAAMVYGTVLLFSPAAFRGFFVYDPRVLGLLGQWTYTSILRTAVESTHRVGAAPSLFQGVLFAALFVGMVASALQRGSFTRARVRPPGGRLRHLAGGTVMGFGAATIPGGNDTLILTGIPTLSIWALAGWAAMLAGVACALIVMPLAARPPDDAGGGVCADGGQPPAHPGA